MNKRKFKVGDIVQIIPEHNRWGIPVKPYRVTRTFGSYENFFISIEGREKGYFEYRFEHAYKDIQSLDHLTPEYKKLFT